MVFGALGAVATYGALRLASPPPARFALVDLVSILHSEIESLAKRRVDGEPMPTEEAAARAQQVHDAILEVANEHGRVILARQVMVTAPTDDVPDLTEAVRARLGLRQ
jgi:xanthosine utilization system XapX-like protein